MQDVDRMPTQDDETDTNFSFTSEQDDHVGRIGTCIKECEFLPGVDCTLYDEIYNQNPWVATR